MNDCENAVPELKAGLDRLANAGIFIVMASGNDAGDASMNLPGCINGTNIFTVGAIDCTGECAFYSNYGPSVDWIAVGTNVFSTYLKKRYMIMSGTSMATAVISGVIHARGAAPVPGPTVSCGNPLANYKIGKRN